MNKIFALFFSLVIYPMTLNADPFVDSDPSFDHMPIKQQERDSITKVFWNAQSIQKTVKSRLPASVKKRFSKADGCSIKSIIKTEGSVDVCELKDDPEKNAQYIYSLYVTCNEGSYQVSICSHKEAHLLNELKVKPLDKLASDDNLFDPNPTM